MKSEQTKAPDKGVQISRLLGSLRSELASWFKSAVQLHEKGRECGLCEFHRVRPAGPS